MSESNPLSPITMSEANARPLAIFFCYMVFCLYLGSRCLFIFTLGLPAPRFSSLIQFNGRRPSARTMKLMLFFYLCFGSLIVTWDYMALYFKWSYIDWATTHGHPLPGPGVSLLLGEWLNDTSLFKQAWASTLETPERAWWSLQIFGFCAIFSVTLAVQARKRDIPSPWFFMLLGQLVAVSVASNLYFMTVLVYDEYTPRRDTKDKSSSAFQHLFILGLNVSLALIIPSQFGQPGFLKLLLVPHVLTFVPLLIDRFWPQQWPQEPSWLVKIGVMAAIVGTASYRVIVAHGSLSILKESLFDHPAVSSVGWDVICCWLSYFAWFVFGRE